MGDAALDSRASEPGDGGAAVVVAAGAALREGHPAEFGGPDHQSIFKQAARFQIIQADRHRLSVAAAIGGSSLEIFAWLSQLLVGPPAPLQT